MRLVPSLSALAALLLLAAPAAALILGIDQAGVRLMNNGGAAHCIRHRFASCRLRCRHRVHQWHVLHVAKLLHVSAAVSV